MFARGSARYLVTIWVVMAAAVAGAIWDPRLWFLVAALAPVVALVTWFFRDPERAIGADIVSPADGRVLSILEGPTESRLTIFMSPIDVHVNRSPADGVIAATEYHQGSHVPAFRKESDRNERFEMDLKAKAGTYRIRLIAGTVARRIHPYISPGSHVKKGDRIGLISFGSRCELILPPGKFRFTVKPGDHLKAGRTTVAAEAT